MTVRPLCTRLTELLGIRYPIVQTGMGYVAGSASSRPPP
jgi:NAD(P)H-dependent flavin oxidoreductase YrpB (nitropropane dioxygenase family)